MNIDALWITNDREVKILPTEINEPGYMEVQVEIKVCGICAMDTYLFSGGYNRNYPFKFGHEGVGIVRKVGNNVNSFREGDKVFCAGGAEMMAQIVNVPVDRVAKIPYDADNFQQWIGEPITCVVNALELTPITPGDTVILIGAGYMGLLNIQGLAHTLVGKVIAFDIDNTRLQLAREFGADEVYNSNSTEGQEAINRIKEGCKANVVIEASGSNFGLELANDLLKKGGVLSIFAWHKAIRQFDGTHWHMNGYKIINTSPFSNNHFAEMIERTAILMNKGIFDQRKLITHSSDYHKAQQLFEIAYDKADNYIKGVVTF